ncbi:MAG TPA: GGDEF domain-containing protein, partial [Thermomicrobiales bacterium]|nr:GGDEF domain-containing protein [Thermomicrobiales bacterium]
MSDPHSDQTLDDKVIFASQPLTEFVTRILGILMIASTTLFAAYSLVELFQPGDVLAFLLLRSIGTIVLVACTAVWLGARNGEYRIAAAIPGLVFISTISICTTIDTWLSHESFEIALAYGLVICVLSVLLFRIVPSLVAGFVGTLGPPLILMFSQRPDADDLVNFSGLTVITVLLAISVFIVQRKVVAELFLLNHELVAEAGRDDLTGLMNRRHWSERVTGWEAEHPGAPSCIIYMDLDRFKAINDRRGHDVGDQALIAYARILKQALPAEAMAARFGGDEFVVFVPGDRDDAETFVDTLQETVQNSVLREFDLRVSIGLAQAEPGIARDELLRQADQAMLAA